MAPVRAVFANFFFFFDRKPGRAVGCDCFLSFRGTLPSALSVIIVSKTASFEKAISSPVLSCASWSWSMNYSLKVTLQMPLWASLLEWFVVLASSEPRSYREGHWNMTQCPWCVGVCQLRTLLYHSEVVRETFVRTECHSLSILRRREWHFQGSSSCHLTTFLMVFPKADTPKTSNNTSERCLRTFRRLNGSQWPLWR